MDRLHHDWLTKGLIDYEYKKYLLLAYLKDVAAKFDGKELYPFLSDLVFHFRNLKKVQDSKELLYESFPQSLTKADFRKLKLVYRQMVSDDEVIKCLEEVIRFALPKIKGLIEEGKALHEFVEAQMHLEPVGLLPIYRKEGYLFVEAHSHNVFIYRYQVTIFEGADERYQGISTTLLGTEKRAFQTYSHLKLKLIRQHRDLPNPATYLLTVELPFPMVETLLPVAKRKLVSSLAA